MDLKDIIPYFVFFYSFAPIPGYSLLVAAPILREKSQVAMNETRVFKNRLCPPADELPPREASPHLMVSKNLVYVKWIRASKSKLTVLFKPSPYGCVQKWVWYRWPNILFPIQKQVVLMVYGIPYCWTNLYGIVISISKHKPSIWVWKNPHYYADAGPINSLDICIKSLCLMFNPLFSLNSNRPRQTWWINPPFLRSRRWWRWVAKPSRLPYWPAMAKMWVSTNIN